ncbi:hypothetical protein BH10PSE4_BH10PSE4_44380 [soil metagenome]
MSQTQAIALLASAADELSQIRRGTHYREWRDDNVDVLGKSLATTAPFERVVSLSIPQENGAPVNIYNRIGDWAVDQLVARVEPENMLARLADELSRNSTPFVDVYVIDNSTINAPCLISPALEVAPAPPMLPWPLGSSAPATLAEVRQPFTVSPAYIPSERAGQMEPILQVPSALKRTKALPAIRYACLLASSGPIELRPLRVDRDLKDLFTPPRFHETAPNTMAGPKAHHILAVDLKAMHDGLARFAGQESLFRAIERLGRARRAHDPVDQALELGIALEIAMTHSDQGGPEITYRLSTRLAWLLGKTAEDRQTIFKETKALYAARSKAVHEGRLLPKHQPDLVAGDRLVTRALRTLVERGAFPDWNKLTMGAG